jgi:hypothetical protein
MIKMLEEKVDIKCLQRDMGLVREILPECERQFA